MKYAAPEKTEKDGWGRKIARQATTTGAILITYDFAKKVFFVTECDLKQAVILEYNFSLKYLMDKYEFTDEHLV